MNWYKLGKLIDGTIKDEFLSFEYIKQPLKEEETFKMERTRLLPEKFH